MLTFMLTCVTCTSDVMSLGWGVGMLTFMLTFVICTSDVMSLGWGVGMLTFMLTCVTAFVATIKVRHTMQSLDQIQRPC